MVLELTEAYVPEQFLFRVQQMNDIEDTFKNFKEFGYGGNKLVVGASGAGKTSLTKYIINKHDSHVYISAKNYQTTNKILLELTNTKKKTDTCDLCRKWVKQLKENKKVVIIDEFDKCKDVWELGNQINEVYRETGVPFIIISSNWNILKFIPEDAYMTLIFERIEFMSYDAIQLREILDQRLDLLYLRLPEQARMPESAKEYICAKVVRTFNGSARFMLDLALKCIMKSDFSIENIELVCQKKDYEEWLANIYSLGNTEKKFLNNFIDLEQNNKEVLTSDIHEKMPEISKSRISQIVGFLSNYGFIEIKNVRKGEIKSVGNLHRAIFFASEDVKNSIIKILRPWGDLEFT